MKLLIIDTETTNLDNPKICEIAATLYQVNDNVRETGAIASISTLLPVKENPAEYINGITAELTKVNNSLVKKSLSLIKAISSASDYAIAFNAEFDAPLVNELLGITPTWLCAMKDFDWSYPNANYNGSYRLVDLALWLGIGVSNCHRAGDDVRLLVECMNRRKETLPGMLDDAIAVANSPMIELKALVNYDNRELAKVAGFAWDGDRKSWIKKMRQCYVAPFKADLKFKVEIIAS